MDRDVKGGLQAAVDEWQGDRPAPRILDAGCGRKTHVDLKNGAHVTGIDIDPNQLARNNSVDELIIGDLETYPLTPEGFDLVICWDLLEHLSNPRAAMANLARAVRPGGLLLIAGPNVLSIKGAATKLTPYWLHRLYYRRNQPHLAPFRTYLRVATSPKLMARWADRRGLTVAYAGTYESGMQVALRRRLRWTGATWSIFERIARALTMGFFEPAATDFVFLFRRAA